MLRSYMAMRLRQYCAGAALLDQVVTVIKRPIHPHKQTGGRYLHHGYDMRCNMSPVYHATSVCMESPLTHPPVPMSTCTRRVCCAATLRSV